MRRWPLRWKIAFYAAALGVVATLAGAGTTWTLMHIAEVRALDRELGKEAREILGGFPAQEEPAEIARMTQKLSPLLERDRLLDLRTDAGEVRFRSPNSEGLWEKDLDTHLHTQHFAGRSFRVGQFRSNGLRLRLAGDLADIRAIGRDIILGMLGAVPTVLLVVFLGGRWVARQALGPVEKISAAAAGISAHRLDQRLPLPSANDEIAELVSVLNATFERLQRSFEQSVRFSSDASHHLKTPIAVLRAGVEEILHDPESSATAQARADVLLQQTSRLTSIAENLLLLARADAGRLELQPEPLQLSKVLAGAMDDLRALAGPSEIAVETEVPPNLLVRADRFALALITQNLIENAVKYNRARGRVRLAAETNDSFVRVTVGNTGDPIPPERANQIFERFYRARTDQRLSGQGLGLSIARELARALEGDLKLGELRNDWTEFVLTLPRVEASA